MSEAGTTPADDLFAAAERAFARPFGAVLRLEPESGAALWVDGRGAQAKVLTEAPGTEKEKDDRAACVWRASRETLIRILDGERQLASSYVSGRLAVSGDMSVMTRLDLERGT